MAEAKVLNPGKPLEQKPYFRRCKNGVTGEFYFCMSYGPYKHGITGEIINPEVRFKWDLGSGIHNVNVFNHDDKEILTREEMLERMSVMDEHGETAEHINKWVQSVIRYEYVEHFTKDALERFNALRYIVDVPITW